MSVMVYGPGHLPEPLVSQTTAKPSYTNTQPATTTASGNRNSLPALPVLAPLQTVGGNVIPAPRMPLVPKNAEDAKLRKAAQQFEAVFIQQMLEQMDKTVDRSKSMLNGGFAEDTFRGMLNQEIATRMSTRPGGSGFGFAESVYQQLSRQMHPGESIDAQLSKMKGAPNVPPH